MCPSHKRKEKLQLIRGKNNPKNTKMEQWKHWTATKQTYSHIKTDYVITTAIFTNLYRTFLGGKIVKYIVYP